MEKVAKEFSRALELHQNGKLGEAELVYQSLLKMVPNTPEVLTNLGTLYLQRYELQKSASDQASGITLLQRSLAINPDQPNLYNNLSIAYIQQRQLGPACLHYEGAIERRAASPALHLMMGALLLDSGQTANALAKFDAAIAANPGEVNAWYNRGNALRVLRRFDEALTSFRRCIKLKPDHVEARINMGALLQDVKDYPAAITYYDEALALRPESVTATYNRALALEITRHFAQAVDGYDRVLELSPAYPYVLGRRQFARMLLCNWTNYAKNIDEVKAAASAGFPAAVPFTLLAMTDDPALQRQCAASFCRDKFPGAECALSSIAVVQGRKIKVGYFSADFRTHAVGFLTAGLFEAHDREGFEFVGVSLGSTPEGDLYHERIKSACDVWIDASRMTDAEVVAKAHALGLDVAVDLAGHTMDARTGIFAQRVAPVQVSYLGYPGSMGAPYMDALLADGTVVPEGAERDYTETVARLPGCFQVNDRARAIGPILPRDHYSLPEGGLVLASFNTSYKLNPDLFDIWCKLLIAAPDAVLWLLGETPEQMENLSNEAEKRGVDPSRLVFAGRMDYSDHLARYAHVDLVLDTWPFNGGTSTSDALWGGAPVLTMTGRAFASRMSASLLNAVGLPELVTGSLADYEQLGSALVGDKARLAAMKLHLASVRLNCPLFDTKNTTREIEGAYKKLLEDQSVL